MRRPSPRVVQRTPNLGIAVRMQRPGGAVAAATPVLGWWDPDAGSFTRQVETFVIGGNYPDYLEPSIPRAVVASLAGAAGRVDWEATWGDSALTVPTDPARDPGSPDVFIGGNVAVAVDGPQWDNRDSGVLQLWATWSGTRYGPITLIVANNYYG